MQIRNGARYQLLRLLPLLACLLFVARESRCAQTATRITSEVSCPECNLTIERVAVLGASEGKGGLVSGPVTVTQNSQQEYYVLQFLDRTNIRVFGPDGNFVRAIGQRGAGPGEFKRINFIRVSEGDTLHVYDGGTRRHSVLSPSSEYVRGRLLEMNVASVVELENGEVVFNGVVATPDRIGLPLHLLNGSGRPVRSFGSYDDVALYRGDLPYLAWRRMAPGGGNRVWVASMNRYVIELWDTDGNKRMELIRDAEWFEPYIDRAPLTPEKPGNPALAGIAYDADGRIWVATRVPALDWAEKLGSPVETPRGPQYRATPEAWDTIIELIDVDRNRLVMSRRISPTILGFISDHVVFAYRETQEGVPLIDIWRLRVE